MKERWIEYMKKADFNAWGEALGISPLTARILKNRGIDSVEEADRFLNGTMKDLSSPYLMKDMEKAVRLIREAEQAGYPAAIVSDFDDDGIFAGEILYEGLSLIGVRALLFTPNRVREGYGINRRIIDELKQKGCRLIITCDNGIAALSEIAYAKSLGLTVIVTDHHEVQYEDEDGVRTWLLPPADAILNPKQADCNYPFKKLCGAGVAFRLIQALYEVYEVPKEKEEELYEYAAIATVADVMELQGENRIIVRAGLEKLRNTEKLGLKALMEVCALDSAKVSAYTVGFVIGPCFNAVGRLSDVRLAFDLLQTADTVTAYELAGEIRSLNESRKKMTEDGTEEAIRIVEESGIKDDRILLVRLHGVHESIVGIIAGRLKEKYYRPVFVFTDSEGGLKGSGRSIPAYHMLDGLLKAREYLTRFGGHAMAAGLSLSEENLPGLREKLNAGCTLTEEELRPVIRIDARVPLSYLSEQLVNEISALEPFGTGNPRPVFARPHFRIHSIRLLGKNRNVLRMSLSDGSGVKRDAVLFNDVEGFLGMLRQEFGEEELRKAEQGLPNAIDIAFTYAPEINEFRGEKSLQIVCQSSCRIV